MTNKPVYLMTIRELVSSSLLNETHEKWLARLRRENAESERQREEQQQANAESAPMAIRSGAAQEW